MKGLETRYTIARNKLTAIIQGADRMVILSCACPFPSSFLQRAYNISDLKILGQERVFPIRVGLRVDQVSFSGAKNKVTVDIQVSQRGRQGSLGWVFALNARWITQLDFHFGLLPRDSWSGANTHGSCVSQWRVILRGVAV